MGSSTDIMRTYISREIAGAYSGSSGWNIAQSNVLSGYNQVNVLEKIENGRRDTVLLGISFDRAVSEDLVNAMKQTTIKNSVYLSGKPRCEILVPKNADTSSVPAGCQIRFMSAFGFEGDSLIWYKKPVQTSNPPKAA